MRNKDVSEEQIGPGQRPARAGGDAAVLEGRPRSPGSPQQPSTEAHSPHTEARGPGSRPQTAGLRAKLCSLKAGSEETRV